VDAPRLDADLVRRVALLARLGLDESELEGLSRQLADLLGHFEALQAVDTTGVDPLVHALDTRGSAADDAPAGCGDARASLLPLTRHAREGFYVVPRVLEADFGDPSTSVATGAPDEGAEPSGG
jgi:aspartyl-tRNA(Asn)/glutamyl-tRNA(Gln) amidotransferase subunit C